MSPPYSIDYTKIIRVLDIIDQSDKNQMRDKDYIVGLIRQVGLHNDPTVSKIYGKENQKYLSTFGMLQIPEQLADCLIYLSDKKIEKYLEIGTFNGIATAFISAYLHFFNPNIKIKTVDITERYHPYFAEELKRRFNIEFFIGTSEDIKREESDLCFIDGDHSYEWVDKDYRNVGKYSKICMFHDVNATHIDTQGSRLYWFNLKVKNIYNYVEFIREKEQDFGIGLEIKI